MDFHQSPPAEIFGIPTPLLFFGTWAVGVGVALWIMVRYYKSRTRSNLREDLHETKRRAQRPPHIGSGGGPPRR